MLLFGKRKIDIHSKKIGIAGRLSNFTKREFSFDGIKCRSIEGVLQSFKFSNPEEQKIVCGLYGVQAKLAGELKAEWKQTQTLYWNNSAFKRDSEDYKKLLSRLYLAVYEQDELFRKDIEKAKKYILVHSIGNPDPSDTVLTEKEFIALLKKNENN